MELKLKAGEDILIRPISCPALLTGDVSLDEWIFILLNLTHRSPLLQSAPSMHVVWQSVGR